VLLTELYISCVLEVVPGFFKYNAISGNVFAASFLNDTISSIYVLRFADGAVKSLRRLFILKLGWLVVLTYAVDVTTLIPFIVVLLMFKEVNDTLASKFVKFDVLK
jgi:hypothetical protein